MKKIIDSKKLLMAIVVFAYQAGIASVSIAQTQYYTLLDRISPNSCIQMSITITTTDTIIANTSVIADDTSSCGTGYAVGSVTLDSFGNYSFPSGADGWLLFFDSTPVCMAQLPSGGSGAAACECVDGLLEEQEGDCHLYFHQTTPQSAYVRCDNISCTANCCMMFYPAPWGGHTYTKPGVLVSGNVVNYNGITYEP